MSLENKKKIAVFFGAPSPEHDVSVVTGLQVLGAIDPTAYDAFPVYISPKGEWFIGDALRERKNYLFDREARKEQLTRVTLDLSRADAMTAKGRLLRAEQKLFKDNLVAEFDVAIPVFHGLYGEDGAFQGMMEFAGIPYVGMRALASGILMDKAITKPVMRAADIPVLPFAQIRRPDEGLLVEEAVIKAVMKDAEIDFPCILKPTHLGSSIGVAKVESAEQVVQCLLPIFKMDDSAILEPFVENLVEYNVSVSKVSGEIELSAIERPKTHDELLDFKQKYLSGKDSKTGDKLGGGSKDGAASEGMLSLTRELNPKLTKKLKTEIETYAKAMFAALGGTGAPRIDFIGNSKSGEIWLNEVNPLPGSFSYFLWEAAEKPLLFSELLTALIKEASRENRKCAQPNDPVPSDARLLRRPLSE